MKHEQANSHAYFPPAHLSRWLEVMLAASCGLIAANLYYSQPLIAPIGRSLGLSSQAAGLIVTMTQIGYGVGLLFVVPLGDLIENRRLVIAMLSVAACALFAATVTSDPHTFLIAALFIGLGSVAVQVLVPYAAHLVSDERRGQVVGNIMAGLMSGIMLSRPLASFVADALSWQAVFTAAAIATATLGLVLYAAMPPRRPAPGQSYGGLLSSMARLIRTTPILRRRALDHAGLFGAFSLFWTTVPLLLADVHHMSQSGIALFALTGVSGALAAPIAGQFGDRGLSEAGIGLAIAGVAATFVLGQAGSSNSTLAFAAILTAAVLLNFAVTAHFVFGQRDLFALDPQIRGRLNGLYMATFFLGGAIGSAAGTWAYASGGWSLAQWLGLLAPSASLARYLVETVRRTGR